MRKLKQESLDAAFTKLYEETYDSVLRYIICRCAAPSDIGDLVQNTYLALYQRLRRSGEPVRDPQHYACASPVMSFIIIMAQPAC